MNKLLPSYISSLIILLAAFTSCSLSCDQKITNDYIENTCGLYNGLRLEELKVDSLNEDQTPKIYTIVAAVEGQYDRTKLVNQDRNYFNDSSGNYFWTIDTATTGVYRNSGIDRERIDIKEIVSPDTSSSPQIAITSDSSVRYGGKPMVHVPNDGKRYYSCPVKFKPDTWYYLDFNDWHAAYLYVNKDMHYRIEKINLPTNY